MASRPWPKPRSDPFPSLWAADSVCLHSLEATAGPTGSEVDIQGFLFRSGIPTSLLPSTAFSSPFLREDEKAVVGSNCLSAPEVGNCQGASLRIAVPSLLACPSGPEGYRGLPYCVGTCPDVQVCLLSSYSMKTVWSVRQAVRLQDWVFSIGLTDAFLLVSRHTSTQRFLRLALSPR